METGEFAGRELVCVDEASAREEAERQQRYEREDFVWVCLEVDGRWVARRIPRVRATAGSGR